MDEPVGLGLAVGKDGEHAAEEVGGEDEDEDGGADADDGAHGLEALPVLELVELGEELGGAHEADHADELHRAEVAAAAHGGADDDVEGEAAGEVGKEPGPRVVGGDLRVLLDDVALNVGHGDEGEEDVHHEDAVDRQVRLVGRAQARGGVPDECDPVRDGEGAVYKQHHAQGIPDLLRYAVRVQRQAD